jgi:hypothetical protein
MYTTASHPYTRGPCPLCKIPHRITTPEFEAQLKKLGVNQERIEQLKAWERREFGRFLEDPEAGKPPSQRRAATRERVRRWRARQKRRRTDE